LLPLLLFLLLAAVLHPHIDGSAGGHGGDDPGQRLVDGLFGRQDEDGDEAEGPMDASGDRGPVGVDI
jgi:hypothetical protein